MLNKGKISSIPQLNGQHILVKITSNATPITLG